MFICRESGGVGGVVCVYVFSGEGVCVGMYIREGGGEGVCVGMYIREGGGRVFVWVCI